MNFRVMGGIFLGNLGIVTTIIEYSRGNSTDAIVGILLIGIGSVLLGLEEMK